MNKRGQRLMKSHRRHPRWSCLIYKNQTPKVKPATAAFAKQGRRHKPAKLSMPRLLSPATATQKQTRKQVILHPACTETATDVAHWWSRVYAEVVHKLIQNASAGLCNAFQKLSPGTLEIQLKMGRIFGPECGSQIGSR